MPGVSKKILPPKKKETGNGKVKPMPSGPSPKVREDFIRKIVEVIKRITKS